MSVIDEWATMWNIGRAALSDLKARLCALDTFEAATPAAPRSEAAVQAAVRAQASTLGFRVWRNNLGAYQDPKSLAFVRYGLANDSAAVNARIKSADLIGCRPRLIEARDVGRVIGQFVSYECKHAAWRFNPRDEREAAQYAWGALVSSLGGDSRFVTDAEQINHVR